jgi:predicted deacylase
MHSNLKKYIRNGGSSKNHKEMMLILDRITLVLVILIAVSMGMGSAFAVESPATTSTLDSNVAGDVTQNSEVTANVPPTDSSKQILENQKQGSTVTQYGDGTGNKLLIWAGIHGNEEEANIATMQYMEYIKGLQFDGTLYVVPFAIPKDTAVNSRDYGPIAYSYTAWVPYKKGWYKSWYQKRYKKYYRSHGKKRYYWTYKWRSKWKYGWLYKPVPKIGYKYEDPNRIANIAGTPGWNIVEFARNNGIKNILDVHSGGDLSGYTNGVIYATTPTKWDSYQYESNWANYIKSITQSAVEYGSGQPGMVRIQGHQYGINTITLEVERDGNTLQWAAVELNMIKAACKYFGFPG